MRIIVRAFNKDGYHKDILLMNDRQVYQNDVRVKEPRDSAFSGLIGYGGKIDPKDFPEMTHFEIVVDKHG